MARILVVDDDFNIRMLVTQILRKAGYETIEAENGRLALEMLKDGQAIDLVISDVLMSEMNGLQLLEKVKQEFATLPVIILSVHTRSAWVQEALQKGATAYLLKPFTPPQLTTIVADALLLSSE